MPTPEPYPYRKLNYPIVNLEQSFTLAEKLQALANLGVPSSVNKAGQVLTVGDDTGELEWADASGSLPESTSADEGKVLTVDSNGDPQWEEPSGGTITDVQVDGVSVVTDGVAEITMPNVPTKTSELTNDSGFITSSDIPAIPTKTSELTNDSGFITSADLPTVNDGTLTIQKNGATVETFTANSSTNKTVNITVPTKTSDLTNDSGFVTSADLPTVNDGTLTIQKNGTTIDTFTANSSSNKTVDISVPTKTSDLTNDSGFITSSDIPAAPVSDVQVDGVSVVSSGVANITLPTVNDGTLTIQKNGTTIDTFTANSSANKTVDISVPTKTSDLNNDSGFITSSSLPTVNDATLTIQKNGTTVDTFTANASSNKTVNITVPTKTSDLNNDSGFITSGDIPAQVNSDWNANSGVAEILNKPTTTPIVAGANITITETQNGIEIASQGGGTAQVNSDWNATSGVAEILNKPTIPAAQVNSDWNAASGVAKILNKPTTTPIVAGANITITDTQNGIEIAATGSGSQVNSDWNATSGVAEILNKPDLSVYATQTALAGKEDEFDAGDGLEFTTDGQGNRVLQVEAPVDIVAGPGIVIDNPDGNTLRISVAHLDDWEDVSSEITKSTTIITGGSITFRYNKAMKMISLIGEIHVQGGGDVYILPEKYRPQTNFTLSNPGATSYIDYTPSTGKFVARSGANGYFSWTMTMPCLGE